MKKILIVEDMALLQETLANTINGQEDMKVVGVAVNADDALDLCRRIAPDLVLMDVVTDGKANGIAAAAKVRQELPNVKVVIMTSMPEITFINAAKKAGAQSFVYKNAGSRHLLNVIRDTLSGNSIYPGPGDEIIAKAQFSNAEIGIMRLACQGSSRSEMAQAMNISEGRVKALVTGILNKTGFENIMKFSVYAIANGFIVPHDK